jgi:hypothetical protein
MPTKAPRNGMNSGEQEYDEAGRELPAPDQGVGGDRDEHRAGGRQDLELRQQQQDRLELAEQQRERRDGGAGAVAPVLALGLERRRYVWFLRRRSGRGVVLHV